MNYEISEQRLIDIMKNFYETMKGEPLPKIAKIKPDYGGVNLKYLDEDGRALFLNYDRRYSSPDNWEVSNIFEPIYDFFGEENFEFFIRKIYKLDIAEKGNKEYNWSFVYHEDLNT